MSVANDLRVPKAPPAWFNAAVRGALRTPGLRRVLGGSIAVLTVTGTKTGRRYPVPVQPLSWNGRVVVLSLRSRVWWRNLRTRPDVELFRRGRSILAHAEIRDSGRAREVVVHCLQENPRAAKTYGLRTGGGRTIDDATLDELAGMLVVVAIEPLER